jgi:hypothetical protein
MLAVTNNRNTLLVIKKNTETLTDASKEGGLKVNVEKTKYMLVAHDQNAGQNWDIKLANRYFKNVSQFKYLCTTVTNQNSVQEDIKRRLNSDNSCYHSDENLGSSRFLPKNIKIRINKTIIFPVASYGCKTRSLTLREEHRLRVFEKRVLRRIFEPQRGGVTGVWRKMHNEEHHDLYSLPSIIRIIKSRRMRWAGACGKNCGEEECV